MQPLYLDPEQTVRVTVDGPSLLVQQEGKAARRFPFSRVARVVVCGAVELETAALVECLQRGIAVSFLTSDGTPAGAALPTHPRQSRFDERLEEFLERPDWRTLYENWRRAAERREILRSLRRLRLHAPDLRPAAAAVLVDGKLDCQLDREWRQETLRWLEGLLAALVNECISEAGLSPQALAGRRPGFRLPSDLAAVLMWGLKAELSLSLAAGAVAPVDTERRWRRRLTSWFETRRSYERNRAVRLLDNLSYWVGGVR
jgi:hypothetical protein